MAKFGKVIAKIKWSSFLTHCVELPWLRHFISLNTSGSTDHETEAQLRYCLCTTVVSWKRPDSAQRVHSADDLLDCQYSSLDATFCSAGEHVNGWSFIVCSTCLPICSGFGLLITCQS